MTKKLFCNSTKGNSMWPWMTVFNKNFLFINKSKINRSGTRNQYVEPELVLPVTVTQPFRNILNQKTTLRFTWPATTTRMDPREANTLKLKTQIDYEPSERGNNGNLGSRLDIDKYSNEREQGHTPLPRTFPMIRRTRSEPQLHSPLSSAIAIRNCGSESDRCG